MNIIKYIILILIFSFYYFPAFSQIKGIPQDTTSIDSNYIFESPRPLIYDVKKKLSSNNNFWGFEFLLSNSGFGGGIFYQKSLGSGFQLFSTLFISGARKSDEIAEYDYQRNDWFVPNKVNRLYILPLNFGVQKYLLENVLFESLKPYLQIGAGPTFILSTPYSYEFFEAFKYTESYIRVSTFAGIGALIGSATNSFMAVNIRYYFIPFGGSGLESVRDLPITDFGGFFLSLSLGTKF